MLLRGRECCRKGGGKKYFSVSCLQRKRHGCKEQTCFLRKSAAKVPKFVESFCCLNVTRYVGRWIGMLQQDRLQTEKKALTNYSVSLAEFIPETLLQLLGKELPLRECSKFLKSWEVKPFIKMQLASSQDPSKEHLGTLWALGYLWIVCTNIPPSSGLIH